MSNVEVLHAIDRSVAAMACVVEDSIVEDRAFSQALGNHSVGYITSQLSPAQPGSQQGPARASHIQPWPAMGGKPFRYRGSAKLLSLQGLYQISTKALMIVGTYEVDMASTSP